MQTVRGEAMAASFTLNAQGDLIYAHIPAEFPGPFSALVADLRQQLPGKGIDWVAVREAYQHGRGRPFPIANRRPESALDEKAKIRFSQDRLTAYLILYPPKPRGVRPDESQLITLTAAYGIPSQLLDRQALRMAQLRRAYREPEPIARGRPSIDGEPARVEWKKGTPSDPEGFLAALEELEEYPQAVLAKVEEGEIVGIEYPAGVGIPGLGADGEPLPARVGENPLELAAGLRGPTDGGAVTALTHGHLQLRGIGGVKARVLPLLRVRDPQELEPWSQQVYGGSVIVEGDLDVPFPVRILGDMEVHGGIVRSAIDVMGSLFVRDGVIQHRGSPVRVGGIASAAFLDKAWLEAHTVHVRRYSLKSRILAFDSLVAPATGNVRGGHVAARNRVRVGSLGSDNAMPTTVNVGDSGASSAFQALYRGWAELLERTGPEGESPAADFREAARKWHEIAKTASDVDLGEVAVEAQQIHAGVTVRAGPATRTIEHTVGPVSLGYERMGSRGRVSMTRR